MKEIQDLLMCPVYKCDLSENLEYNKCGNKFSYEHGVFDVVFPKLSSNQEILWRITDDMIENDIEVTKQEDNDNACIKDYNANKNKEV